MIAILYQFQNISLYVCLYLLSFIRIEKRGQNYKKNYIFRQKVHNYRLVDPRFIFVNKGGGHRTLLVAISKDACLLGKDLMHRSCEAGSLRACCGIQSI
jgi:hypothetical protein